MSRSAELPVLRMVVWRGYDDREAAAPFLAAHGLTIEPIYVDADVDGIEIVARRPGEIDVVALDNRYLPLLLRGGLLAPIDASRLAHAADLYPTFVRYSRGEDGTLWSVPYIWGRHPLPYNPAFVTEPPTSWLDVLRPEYRGKVAMLDGPHHQLVLWGRVLGYPDPARVTREQLRRAAKLACRVKRESQARLAPWDEIPALLASGDAWIATAGWEAVARFAAAEGVEIRLSYPKEDPYPWLDGWCIPRGAPNQDAAYAWIDWMIGVEAQAIVCRNLPCGSANQRAVPELAAETRAMSPHERIDQLFVPGAYVGIPPLDPEGGLATLDDWSDAWEDVRAA